MKLVNLTGHPCALYDADGECLDLMPDPRYVGIVAVAEHRSFEDEQGRTFSLNVRRVSGVKGLPDPEDDTLYVVPIEIAMAVKDTREDVVYLAEDAEVRSLDGHTRRISHLRRTI